MGRAISCALVALVFTNVGCANRVMAPKIPDYSPDRADLRGVGVHLRSFKLSGAGDPEPVRVEHLQDRFLDYLESTTAISDIFMYHEGVAEGPTLVVDATLELDQTTYRTYVLDLIAFYPLILGVLTPWWGHVDLKMTVTVSDRYDVPIKTFVQEESADFQAVFFSWFRTTYIERAYKHCYQHAFEVIAAQIAATAPELKVAAGIAPRAPPEMLADRPPPDPLTTGAVSPTGLPFDPGRAPTDDVELAFDVDYGQPDKGFGLITESAPLLDGTIFGYLKMLGGIEAAGILGITTVSSGIHTDTGVTAVAAGEARQTGFRLSLYNAPESTGPFIYPVLGFMTQEIAVADFREDLPVEEVDIPGATEIGGLCTDPNNSAVTVDCQEPNVYVLNVHTGYGGLRAGYDLVLGQENFRMFLSAGAGVNLIEFRSVNARIANWESHAESWNVLRSLSVGGTAGIVFPTLHVALRFIFDYQHYLQFAYAEPLEFRGPMIFDEEKQKSVRQQVIVNTAEVGSWTFELATAFVF